MAKTKFRKQLRLGDIYKYIVTGELTPIANLDTICFREGKLFAIVKSCMMYTFDCITANGTHDEKSLREAVKSINKIISEV